MGPSKPVDRDFTIALPKVELHAHLNGSTSRQCLHELWKRKKYINPDCSITDPLVMMPPDKVDYTLQTSATTWKVSHTPRTAYWKTSAPTEFATSRFAAIPREFHGKTRAEYLSTVLDVFSAFQARNAEMSVFLIVALDRGHTTAAEAMDLVHLAIANRERGVVGVDLCGDPTKGDVTMYRDAFAHAKAHGLGLTVHFAETPVSGTRRELDALLDFRPDRLGHVIHVPEDIKEEIVRLRLGLELCMSCNVHGQLIEGGTDDVGFFCSPVSNEYLLAAQHFGIDRAGLVRICEKSVDMIFGGNDEKNRLHRLLTDFKRSDA
ncbi:Metallo-dependent hydrolase [Penicillium chermesinum]|nr:Metallo-dependent hydrolase [Penicillium chermesinum]